MPEIFERLAGYTQVRPPIPGDGPVIHLEHHGTCIIAVKWEDGQSVPWARRAEPESDWYRMALH